MGVLCEWSMKYDNDTKQQNLRQILLSLRVLQKNLSEISMHSLVTSKTFWVDKT